MVHNYCRRFNLWIFKPKIEIGAPTWCLAHAGAPWWLNICTYNEEKSIADCLKSVIKNNPKEIIVIDGGSTDATVQISESMGAKVLISENNGLSSQRQHGIENSTQPFIAIVDADDNLENNFLQILYHELIEYNYDALLGRQIAFEPVTYWEKAMGCLNYNITYNKIYDIGCYRCFIGCLYSCSWSLLLFFRKLFS